MKNEEYLNSLLRDSKWPDHRQKERINWESVAMFALIGTMCFFLVTVALLCAYKVIHNEGKEVHRFELSIGKK